MLTRQYLLILILVFTACAKKAKKPKGKIKEEMITKKAGNAGSKPVRKNDEQKLNDIAHEVRESTKSQYKRKIKFREDERKNIIYPPDIRYVSHNFEELKGNINGVIDAGDRIRLHIKVRNNGKGAANATSAKVISPDKIVFSRTEYTLPYIKPGESGTFSVDINIPSLASETARVIIDFSEGGRAQIEFSIKPKPKKEREKIIEEYKRRLKERRKKGFDELDNALDTE